MFNNISSSVFDMGSSSNRVLLLGADRLGLRDLPGGFAVTDARASVPLSALLCEICFAKHA
eukprot:15469850-Alexandrium_andersonii.AAC.1